MADRVRADEAAQRVLLCDAVGIAEILDELEPVADGQDLGAVHVLDVIREPAAVPVIGDTQAEGVFRRRALLGDLGSKLGEAPLNLAAALFHLAVNGEALGHFVLFGHLEAYDQLLAVGLAVEGVTGGVGPAVFQGLQHRGHLLTHIAGPAAMNQSRNSAHIRFLLRCRTTQAAKVAPFAATFSNQLRQIVPVLLEVPVRHGRHELLPLVALVVGEDPVHLIGHRRFDRLVLVQLGQRLAERHG